MNGDILPAQHHPADTAADWIVAAIRRAPTLHNAIAKRLMGPAFDALDTMFHLQLEQLKADFQQEARLLASSLADLGRTKDAAEGRVADLELRILELQADDEAVAAVRKQYADRLERVDKRFAECRTDYKKLRIEHDQLKRDYELLRTQGAA